MKNIIFLDIDGVLNHQLHYESMKFADYKEAKKQMRKEVKKEEIDRLDYYAGQICKQSLDWFNQLCIDVNADVVISSSWRTGKTVEQLQEIFKYCGGTF